MSSRRRTEIVTETHEIWVLRRRGASRRLCGQCVREAQMLTPHEAAVLRGVSQLTVYRWVESGRLHFIETPGGELFVCLASLLLEIA
jgi:excisionase family DNA binding protein